MQYQVSYKKQFVFSFMLLLILLIMVETVLYIYGEFLLSEPVSELIKINNRQISLLEYNKNFNNIDYEYDHILLMKPNQQIKIGNINSHGFRGPEFDAVPSDYIYRIFVVGGSTTFGYGEPNDNYTISAILQQKFLDSGMDNVEVINAGIGGAMSKSDLYLVTHILADYEPDLIIGFTGVNEVGVAAYDSWNSRFIDARWMTEADDITYYDNVKGSTIVEFNNIFEHYITPTWIMQKLINILKPQIESNPTDDVIDLWYKRWTKICEEYKTVVILQPMLGSGERSIHPVEKHITEQHYVMVDGLHVRDALSLKLPDLDQSCYITDDFGNVFDNRDELIYIDLVHIVENGNEIIAQRMFDLISDKI